MHTYILADAEKEPAEQRHLINYAAGLNALLRERQASLSSLQAQLDTFRITIGAQPDDTA